MTSLKLLINAIMGVESWPSFKGKVVMESLNRAFMYGESVFTTMRLKNGVMQDWDLHFDRLRRGVEFVYGPFTEKDEWITLFKNRLENKFQDLEGEKVVRLTVYREGERGLIRAGMMSVNDLKIHLSLSAFDKSRFEDKSLKLRTCPVNKRPLWWPSYLKSGNYLETILCQKLHMRPGDDDVLFLAQDDSVLESSIANIFVVRRNKLYTAPTGPNVLEGVMRKKVLDVALEYFEDFSETETSMEQLIKADAVFGSNSVRGLFLVDRIDDYEITYTEEILDKFKMLKHRVSL
jgi:branched-subunit amino acid aminotransferase/4-amino-4-deoxychorismate lyase